MKKITTLSIKFVITLILIVNVLMVKSQITILAGVEKGSYEQIAKDLQDLIEKDLRKAVKDSAKIEAQIATVPTTDTIELKKLLKQRVENNKIKKNLEAIRITVLNSDGSVQNFEKLIKRTGVDIAFLQYDVLLSKQMEDLNNNTYYVDDIRILLPLGKEEIHLVVAANSPLNSLQDLNSRKDQIRVATGSQKQGTYITAGVVKDLANFNWLDYPLSFENAFNSLINNKIDAMFFVGAIPVTKFEKLPAASKEKIKLIPINYPALDNKIQTDGKIGPYVKTMIPANTYKWADYDVETYAVKFILATNVSNETYTQNQNILRLMKYICDNIKTLQEKGHRAWKQVDFNFQGIDIEIYEDIEDIITEMGKQ